MNKVIESNKKAFEKVTEIFIDNRAIENFVDSLLEDKLDTSELNLFSREWSLSDAFKITLIFNAMNFCYWAEKDSPKWSIEINGKNLDGAIALVSLLEKLATENANFLDWKYLADLKFEDFRKFFEGSNVEIPLIRDRYVNLTLLARNLISKYDGNSDVLFKRPQDANEMLEKLVDLSCFEDESSFSGEKVYLWKRAQLQIKMFNDISVACGNKSMKNMNTLTAFADYKIPQLLRHLGILSYSPELSKVVDSYILVDKNSKLENEIRIATIIAVEKIKDRARDKGLLINSAQIDSLLWNRAASNSEPMKPYHRTYTAAY